MPHFLPALISGCLIFSLTSALEECSWRFRPNPEDCGSFLVCNFGSPLVSHCPQGLHWNQNILTCDWARNSVCDRKIGTDRENSLHWEQEGRSETCSEEGKITPNPSDCSKYYVCNHGVLLEMSCAPPLVWNTAVSTCDWAYNTDCSGSSTSGPEPPVGVISTDPPPTSTVGPPAPPPDWEETGPPAPPPETTTTTKKPRPTRPTTTPTDGGGGVGTGPDPTIVGIITGPASHDSDPDQGPDPDYKLVCYYTGWSWYRPDEGKFSPADVDGDLCTHYVYAFAILDSNSWTIKPADAWADIDNKFYYKMTQLKKKGKKVSIALGGWNDSEGQKYSLLLRDPTKIQKLIQSVSKFIKEHDFDGIDLDYEYPVCPHGACHNDFASDRNGFTILVKGLRDALPKGSVISAAVSANRDVIDRAYDIRTLSESLDWIGVMDYDIHGSWEKNTGHIAPLYYHPHDSKDYLNVNYSIHHWIEGGAPPAKLVMGVPLYGQTFTLSHPTTNKSLNAPANGPGTAGKYSRQGGILAYYEICSGTWSERVDDEEGRMGPFLIEGDQWVSYDDVGFIQKKMDYVKELGLGGAMAWALDFDDFSNRCGGGKYPLLNAMKHALGNLDNVPMEGGGSGGVLYGME